LETDEQKRRKAELAKKMESPGWEGFKSYLGSAFAGSASDAGDFVVGAVNAALTLGEETLYMAHDSIVQPIEIGVTSKTWADYQPHSSLGRWQENLLNAWTQGSGSLTWGKTETIALVGVGQVIKAPLIDTPIEFVGALFCPDRQRLGAASFNLFAVLGGGRRGSFDPVLFGPGRGKPLPYAVPGGETGPEVGSLQTLYRPPSLSEPVPHKTVILEGPDGLTWSGLHQGRGIFGRVRTGAEESMGFMRGENLKPNVEVGQRVGLNEAQFQRAQAYLERGNHLYTLFTHNCITFAKGALNAAIPPAFSPVQHVGAMIGLGGGTSGQNR
jgi:hypothetical protein